ncbi:unnamed protein product [Brassica napus]|uniref:(rape) hypothetical protein n=1 Tax=Brassica napus TaxID=3708 RepID=A0A816TLT5_BRANA|nr:unnamed protein product [Brassica napus]
MRLRVRLGVSGTRSSGFSRAGGNASDTTRHLVSSWLALRPPSLSQNYLQRPDRTDPFRPVPDSQNYV